MCVARHTGETTASEHVNTCECVYEQLRASETNFHFCFLFFSFFSLPDYAFFNWQASLFCILWTPSAGTVPKPRQPSDSKNTCYSGARTPGRTTQNLSHKPIRQQLFPVHQIKSEVFQVRKNIQVYGIYRESSIQWFITSAKSCLHWLCSPHGPNFTSSNLRHLRQRVYFSKITVIVKKTFLEDLSIIMLRP